MNLERNILNSMTEYPTLYQRADQVLNHLFAVIGNGYQWHKGQLVDIPRRNAPTDGVFITWEQEITNLQEYYKTLSKEGLKLHRRMFTKTYAKKHLITDRICPLSVYPISQYSQMNTVPDDVTPDYLAGAYWLINYILSPAYNRKNDLKSNQVCNPGFIHQQKIKAQKTKDELDRRFNPEFWTKAAVKLQRFINRINKHKRIDFYQEHHDLDENHCLVKKIKNPRPKSKLKKRK